MTGERRWQTIALLASIVSVAAGCGKATSQEQYTYAGCNGLGSYGCPNSKVFVCALTTIEAKHDRCLVAADCVTAPLKNCLGFFSYCPPAAVNRSASAAFLVEANAESGRYCDAGNCSSAGQCGRSYSLGLVDCVGGQCAALQDDGGL